MLRQYNGKAINLENTDLATNYLGYWMDNGAYYYVNYDSWWYLKGEGLGVKDWSPMPEVFFSFENRDIFLRLVG